MSYLTKRLRESYISTGQNYVQEAADRIDALEECLREIISAWDGNGTADMDKARALLEPHD